MAGDEVRRRVLLQAALTFASALLVIFSVVFLHFSVIFFKTFNATHLRSTLSKEDQEASRANIAKVNTQILCQPTVLKVHSCSIRLFTDSSCLRRCIHEHDGVHHGDAAGELSSDIFHRLVHFKALLHCLHFHFGGLLHLCPNLAYYSVGFLFFFPFFEETRNKEQAESASFIIAMFGFCVFLSPNRLLENESRRCNHKRVFERAFRRVSET